MVAGNDLDHQTASAHTAELRTDMSQASELVVYQRHREPRGFTHLLTFRDLHNR